MRHNNGVDYATTAWYVACNGDLRVAHALLVRATDANDVTVLEDEETARRAVSLLKLLGKLNAETKALTTDWPTRAIMTSATVALAYSASADSVIAQLTSDVATMATDALIPRGDVEALTQWELSLADAASPVLKPMSARIAKARVFHYEYAIEQSGRWQPIAVDGSPFFQQWTYEIQTMAHWN